MTRLGAHARTTASNVARAPAGSGRGRGDADVGRPARSTTGAPSRGGRTRCAPRRPRGATGARPHARPSRAGRASRQTASASDRTGAAVARRPARHTARASARSPSSCHAAPSPPTAASSGQRSRCTSVCFLATSLATVVSVLERLEHVEDAVRLFVRPPRAAHRLRRSRVVVTLGSVASCTSRMPASASVSRHATTPRRTTGITHASRIGQPACGRGRARARTPGRRRRAPRRSPAFSNARHERVLSGCGPATARVTRGSANTTVAHVHVEDGGTDAAPDRVELADEEVDAGGARRGLLDGGRVVRLVLEPVVLDEPDRRDRRAR